MHKTLYLAPIRGCTDQIYRNCFHQLFPYFDGAVAPFFTPGPTAKLQRKIQNEFASPNANGLTTEPQVLAANEAELSNTSAPFFAAGHNVVNWNLGCPYPMVTKKKRGAGLLPFPEQIESILSEALPKIPGALSIKIRLGVERPDELAALLPRLNQFPLSKIIIHGRTAKQMYSGKIHLEAVAQCLPLTNHAVVLNGDIRRPQDIWHYEKMFPNISSFMIGRGALANPFLLHQLRGETLPSEKNQRKQLRDFHDRLYEQYQEKLSGQTHLHNKMTEQWNYLCERFAPPNKIFKQIKKSTTKSQYETAVANIFSSAPFAPTVPTVPTIEQ